MKGTYRPPTIFMYRSSGFGLGFRFVSNMLNLTVGFWTVYVLYPWTEIRWMRHTGKLRVFRYRRKHV